MDNKGFQSDNIRFIRKIKKWEFNKTTILIHVDKCPR